MSRGVYSIDVNLSHSQMRVILVLVNLEGIDFPFGVFAHDDRHIELSMSW